LAGAVQPPLVLGRRSRLADLGAVRWGAEKPDRAIVGCKTDHGNLLVLSSKPTDCNRWASATRAAPGRIEPPAGALPVGMVWATFQTASVPRPVALPVAW